MKVIISTAFILLASSSAFAAESAQKNEDGMIKHCQQMVSDPKMADGMSRSMMDQCHALLKDHGTSDGSTGDNKAAPAEHSPHDQPAGHTHN